MQLHDNQKPDKQCSTMFWSVGEATWLSEVSCVIEYLTGGVKYP